MNKKTADPDGRVRPLTPRQQERRHRILATAEAMLAEHGYDGVSMRALAAASDTAEKTLYNIFGTKDRLVAQTAHYRSANAFDEAANAPATTGWDRLVNFARIIGTRALEVPDLSRALALPLIDHFEAVGLEGIYTRHIVPAIEDMVAEGLLCSGTPARIVSRLYRLSMVASVVFWAKGELSDGELGPYVELKAAQAVLPFATETGFGVIAQFAQAQVPSIRPFEAPPA